MNYKYSSAVPWQDWKPLALLCLAQPQPLSIYYCSAAASHWATGTEAVTRLGSGRYSSLPTSASSPA